jgi:hypothetical protein
LKVIFRYLVDKLLQILVYKNSFFYSNLFSRKMWYWELLLTLPGTSLCLNNHLIRIINNRRFVNELIKYNVLLDTILLGWLCDIWHNHFDQIIQVINQNVYLASHLTNFRWNKMKLIYYENLYFVTFFTCYYISCSDTASFPITSPLHLFWILSRHFKGIFRVRISEGKPKILRLPDVLYPIILLITFFQL